MADSGCSSAYFLVRRPGVPGRIAVRITPNTTEQIVTGYILSSRGVPRLKAGVQKVQ